MLPPNMLIGSQNETTIHICEEVAAEIDAATIVKKKIEDILLALQESDFKVIIFDLDMEGMEALKTIRLIRRMRPKIPLITLAEKIDKKVGGEILSEGVFHIILAPNRENLSAALSAVLKIKN
jgi:DNA-binding NarL/FixJ family response regulator